MSTFKFNISFLLLVSCLFIASNGVFGQSRLGSLADGLGGVSLPEPEKAVVKDVKAPFKKIPPINITSASMSDFLELEKNCRARDGDACLYAGKIIMLEKPPQELFDLSSSNRVNRGIRFYETAINLNDSLEAMELAYDLYHDKNVINRQINSYSDKDRAKDLLDQMISKNYAGGQIRQARKYIEDPEFLLSINKKREACATARSLLLKSDITSSTKDIVDELLIGNTCAIFNK